MISKEYHHVITLGIVSYISVDPVFPGSLPKHLSERVNSGNLASPFTIDPQAIIFNDGIIETASIKSLCLLSPYLSILSIVQLKSLSIICFHFPHSYSPYNFVVL